MFLFFVLIYFSCDCDVIVLTPSLQTYLYFLFRVPRSSWRVSIGLQSYFGSCIMIYACLFFMYICMYACMYVLKVCMHVNVTSRLITVNTFVFVWICLLIFVFMYMFVCMHVRFLACPRRCPMLYSWSLAPFGSLTRLQNIGIYWFRWLRTCLISRLMSTSEPFYDLVVLLQDKSPPALRTSTEDWIIYHRRTISTDKLIFQRDTAPWPDHDVFYLACLPRSGQNLDATFSIKVTTFRCVCGNSHLFVSFSSAL